MKHTVVVLIRGSVKTLRHLIAQTIDYLALMIPAALALRGVRDD